MSYRHLDLATLLVHNNICFLGGHIDQVVIPEKVNGFICNHKALLEFLELEAGGTDLHVIEEHLLVSGDYAKLVLSKGLSGSRLLLVHCIIDAERVHFLVKCLNSLHLVAGARHDLQGIAD